MATQSIRLALSTALMLTVAASLASAQRGGGGAPQAAPVSGIGPDGKLHPVIKDGVMQPVTEFSDQSTWIHESVWVETNIDSDHDGKMDRVHVQVVRPGAAEKAGLKIPSLMLASPYIGPTNSVTPDWDMRQELGDTSPTRLPMKFNEPFSLQMRLKAPPATRDVAKGFAAVAVENLGTGYSTGCPTVGDSMERASPKYAIMWLTGDAKGYTTRDGMEEVKATSWSSGKVGISGGSYEGAMPLAAAVTGVKGLEAIIPQSPNSSDYRYYRSYGMVRSPGTYLGEDIQILYDFIHSGDKRELCDSMWRDGIIAKGMDRLHGDYNEFWYQRDYTNFVKNIHAAVLFAHGFNDWNVMPDNTIRMWEALKKINPSAKLYMHQGGHGGAPPADIVNKWWAHYLYGVNNGVDTLPRAMIVPSTAVIVPPPAPAPDPTAAAAAPPAGGRGGRGGRGGAAASGGAGGSQPQFYKDWPIPGSAPAKVFLGKGGSAVGSLSLSAASKQGVEKLVDDWQVATSAMALAKSSPNRLLYALPALTDSVHLSGQTVVTIKMASSKPAANLSVYLVTLPYDETRVGTGGEIGVVTRGWADPQNWKSLTGPQDYTSMTPGEPLVPGKFYTMTFPLQPTDKIMKPGQQMAIMILSSDLGFTMHPKPGTEISVDLDGTSVTFPVVGGPAALKKAMAMK